MNVVADCKFGKFLNLFHITTFQWLGLYVRVDCVQCRTSLSNQGTTTSTTLAGPSWNPGVHSQHSEAVFPSANEFLSWCNSSAICCSFRNDICSSILHHWFIDENEFSLCSELYCSEKDGLKLVADFYSLLLSVELDGRVLRYVHKNGILNPS